jgi:hypothetical protein
MLHRRPFEDRRLSMSASPLGARPVPETVGEGAARSIRHPLARALLALTLTGLAADSRLAGGSGKGSVRRITAVLAMLIGALAGALLLKISLVPPLLAAAANALLVALAYVPFAHREA